MSGNILDFFHAVIRGDTEVVKSLLPSININSKDEKGDGDTALIKALYMGNDDMVSLLLENGANPNIENNSGENAFSYQQFEGLHKLYKARQKLALFRVLKESPDAVTTDLRTAEKVASHMYKGGKKKTKKKKVRKPRKLGKSRKLRKSRKVRKSTKSRIK